MAFWLMKSEPAECSIDDLAAAPKQTLPWIGVRNYQARNFMRDGMHAGDVVLFYHSSCAAPGIAGIAEIVGNLQPDRTQFDPLSPYHDPKSSTNAPRWLQVDVRFVRKTPLITLKQLRLDARLTTMRLLAPGSRLSITPVTLAEYGRILELMDSA
jgi:predicted RNA-binding protein with PUA-like domain